MKDIWFSKAKKLDNRYVGRAKCDKREDLKRVDS